MGIVVEFVKENEKYFIIGLIALVALIILLLIVKACKKKKRKSKVINEVSEVPAEPIVEAQEEKTVEVEEVKTKKVFGKFEVYFVGKAYRYNLKASNGEILVQSELYNSKDGALSAISTLKNSLSTCDVRVSKDKKGLFQFKVFGGNNRILVTSANYNSEASANNAIESFKRFSENANIVEVESSNDLFELYEIEYVSPKDGGKIQLVKEDNLYYFNILANNGAILCASEDYTTRQGAIKGIETLKNAIKTGNCYIQKDKAGNYQFKIYSSANRLIAIGETYKTKQLAKSSAVSLVSFIENAEII